MPPLIEPSERRIIGPRMLINVASTIVPGNIGTAHDFTGCQLQR